ncbi:MAG TPA: hypothetical protein DEA47_01335 [Peptococcaceae bacterium]|nr:hypothetical protein [Peptococcaceae bacterium]
MILVETVGNMGAYFFSSTQDNGILFSRNSVGPYAYVKQGQLFVQHPAEGPYPIVVPCPGTKLIVNDKECKEPTPVTVNDKVRIEVAEDECREGSWSVFVSSDEIFVELQMRPTVLIRRELMDLPPARILHLKVNEREEYIPPFTLDELLQELSRLGINYGIDWEACSRAAASCKEEKIIIARGVPAKPGKDARVELRFSNDSKIPVPIGKDEIVVDFRERFIFTPVEPGDVLAVKHPAEPGIPGTSVKGNLIMPPSPRDYCLTAGEGAIVTQDGKQVVAVRSGRPVAVFGSYMVKISVLPEMVHDSDVNLASGNIVFKGDILISGNVLEGMLVEAGGNVRIGGYVSHAKVRANGSIWIKGNVLSSVVVAGGNNAIAQEIQPYIKTLASGLREMVAAIKQLLKHPAFKKMTLNLVLVH